MSFGFSISELIIAVGQLVKIYNGFCSENASVKDQLTDLIHHLNHFKHCLEKHKQVLIANGLKETEYVAFDAIQGVLKDCREFLSTFEVVTDEKRTLRAGYKVVRFVFNPDGITTLHRKIERLEGTLTFDLVLDNALGNALGKSSPEIVSSSVSTTTTVASSSSSSSSFNLPTRPNSSPQAPQSKGRIILNRKPVQGRSRPSGPPESAGLSRSSKYSEVQDFENPNTNKISPSSGTFLPGLRDLSTAIAEYVPEADTPPLVLPPAALGYNVVEITCDGKTQVFDRRPVVRDLEGGKEIVIIDDDSNLLFSHKIEGVSRDLILPYTWHSKFKSHRLYELTFKGLDTQCHSVSFRNSPASLSVPKYVFVDKGDFKNFQEQISGNVLVDTFETHRISSAISPVFQKRIVGDAIDQQLKCWKNPLTQRYTVSYYASNMRPPTHLEFKIGGMHYDASESNDNKHRFSFSEKSLEQEVPARQSRTFSWGLSRASTAVERPLSIATSGTSSRSSVGGKTSRSSSTTTAPPRSSGSSHNFDPTQAISSSLSLEERMQYIDLDFDSKNGINSPEHMAFHTDRLTEAAHFLENYQTWRIEEMSLPPLSLFKGKRDWQFELEDKSKDSEMERYLPLSPLGSIFSSTDILAGTGYFAIPPNEQNN